MLKISKKYRKVLPPFVQIRHHLIHCLFFYLGSLVQKQSFLISWLLTLGLLLSTVVSVPQISTYLPESFNIQQLSPVFSLASTVVIIYEYVEIFQAWRSSTVVGNPSKAGRLPRSSLTPSDTDFRQSRPNIRGFTISRQVINFISIQF